MTQTTTLQTGARVKLKYKLSYGIISKDNIVLEAGFNSKQAVREWFETPLGSAYKDCRIDIVRTHV